MMAVFVEFRLVAQTDATVEYEVNDLGGPRHRMVLATSTFELLDPEAELDHAKSVAAAKIMREYRRSGRWPKAGAVQS